MTKEDTILEIEILEEQIKRLKTKKLFTFYPETGPLRRELYHKHVEFFEAGLTYLERGVIAANRVGKTTMNAYETTLHLTGLYPEWWMGRRFSHAVDWWAASDTSETTRDILQLEFLGRLDALGTGMIPAHLIIGEPTKRRGVAESVDTVRIKHVTGGTSTLAFKSYDQGREKFQGTKKHGVSLDEEPDPSIYFECLTRVTATVPGELDGSMICTFTPLKGMSTVVLMYMNDQNPSRFSLNLGFDHAPHLSEQTKQRLIQSFPPHERDARTKGIPQLGSGAIYPVPESDVIVDDFQIPDHWPRGYGMDVGWNKTSAGWWAWDRESDVIYRYSEHYRGQAEPAIHAQAILARGNWISGVIDPGAKGRAQRDGLQLLQMYKDLNLDLEVANNAVEAGIYQVLQRLSSGRLKVFKSCQNWIQEFRLYRRDEKGRIVKEKDHAMDETRYFVMSGLERSRTKPAEKKEVLEFQYATGSEPGGWMG